MFIDILCGGKEMRSKLFIVFFLLLPSICYPHGIEYKEIEGGRGLEIKYDDGTPFSFCEVKIYSPDGKKFQEGLTDKNGRFVFFPERTGKWKIEVSDGMGHGVVKEIAVLEGMKIKEENVSNFTRWQKILIGVSLIWGITGTLFYIFTKKT